MLKHLPTIGLHKIGNLRKREKRDPEWEHQMMQCIICMKKYIRIFDKEIRIFIIPEQRQIEDNPYDKPTPLSDTNTTFSKCEIHQYRDDDKQQIIWIPPSIEE